MKNSIKEEIKRFEKAFGRKVKEWEWNHWREVFLHPATSEDLAEEFKDELDWECIPIYEKYCKNKKRKKNTMPDWYEQNIEPTVREVVKLLRNNGINTQCSCGHKKYVQCQYINDGYIRTIDSLLFNNGFRNYEIKVNLRRDNGYLYSFVDINFEDMKEIEK